MLGRKGPQVGRKSPEAVSRTGRKEVWTSPVTEEAYTTEMAWFSGITRDDTCGTGGRMKKKFYHPSLSLSLLSLSLARARARARARAHVSKPKSVK